MRRALLLISLCLPLTASAQTPEGPGEVRLSLGAAKQAFLTPEVSLVRDNLQYGDASLFKGNEVAEGVELGLRLISSSSQDRKFLAGLDLRQSFAGTLGAPSGTISNTRLGIRLELRPGLPSDLGFHLNWFFGDTVVVKNHDRQYNGNSFALGASFQCGRLRYTLEGLMGTYQEGPGFIFLTRPAGVEDLKTFGVRLGAEWPLQIDFPNFLSGRPATI